MARLSYDEFERMLADPNVPDSDIAALLKFDKETAGPFDPRPVPDPQKVDLDDPKAQFDLGSEEDAMRWANTASRRRRHLHYRLRQTTGSKAPVLVSEGDSWFQFPFLIQDVIDQLGSDYLIWSLDAAGDTADNMVNRRPEYLKALKARAAEGPVAGFLFSAAGNDVIGEDELGNPVLKTLLKRQGSGDDPASYVNHAELARVLQRLEKAYRKVISSIRAVEIFQTLPIVIHGYDFAIPGGQSGDPRHPRWAAQDKWLGAPMTSKGITDPTLQRGIIRLLINALYDMLTDVAGDPDQTKVHLVDVRGTLTSVSQWADEIHANSIDGFDRVAERFRETLRHAGVG